MKTFRLDLWLTVSQTRSRVIVLRSLSRSSCISKGRAGTAPSRLGEDHDGRIRPGGDYGQAQGASESGGDAAGHKQKKEERSGKKLSIPGEEWGFR